MTWLTIPDFSESLIEIARMSELWNATIPFNKLTIPQKQAVQTLLWISWKISWDIEFWDIDEAILRVINEAWKSIDNALITVITPVNEFWKNYLN
jgi:hypothetical protein